MQAKPFLVKAAVFFVVTGSVIGVLTTLPSHYPAPAFREDRQVILNGKPLMLELAETDVQTKEGLSDRLSMEEDQGMLFLFSQSDRYSFWMNKMHFPLDIVWLNHGVVVDIARDLPPPSKTAGIPATHVPSADADAVLELTAGGAERYGLKVGTKVDF